MNSFSRQTSVQGTETTTTTTTSSIMTIRTTVSSNVYFPSNSHPLWSTHSSTLPTGITSNYYDQRYAQQRPTDPIFRTPIIRSGVPTHFSFPNTATHLGFYSNSYADMFGTNDPYMNQLRTTAATSSFGQNNGSSTNYQHTSSNRKNDLSSNKNKLYTSPILGSNTSDINVSLSSHHHHSTISNGHRHSHSTNGTLSPSIIDSSGSYHPSQQETNRAILNYQKSDERQLFPLKRSHSPGQNSIHHSSSDDLQTTPINEDILILKKFRRENFVTLSSGEMKNIEKLTTNDFIKSADDSNEYSSILTRVEDVGVVDNKSGKAQIIFDITELQKRIIYDVLEEMPFFVYQQTWSSINPNKTRTVCGLKCRQLEKGDLIIAAMEQDNLTSILTSSLATPSSSPPPSSTSISKNTALSHLSPCKTTPTKFLFKRYIDENTGKNNYNEHLRSETDKWSESSHTSQFIPTITTAAIETVQNNVHRKSLEEISTTNKNIPICSASRSPSSTSPSPPSGTHKRQKLSSNTSTVQKTDMRISKSTNETLSN